MDYTDFAAVYLQKFANDLFLKVNPFKDLRRSRPFNISAPPISTLQTKCNWALKMSANVKPKTDTCYAFKMESARAILVFS